MRVFIISIITLISIGNICVASSKDEISLSVQSVVDTLALNSSQAQIARLNFRNSKLSFDNYKKSFLPSVSLSVSPINFNRSLKLLQRPTDGTYNYIEDYTNGSNAGLSLRQKVGPFGGELTLGSTLNYLNEFSSKQKSFNSNPYSIGYSQQLWGGGKNNRYEKQIQYKKNEQALKKYCTDLIAVQQQSLTLFMGVFLLRMQLDLARINKNSTDTLLYIAGLRLANGSIIESDYKEIELQAANAEYALESAIRSYQEGLQKLVSYLGIESDGKNMTIVTPDFDLPLKLDTALVSSYVRKNNPFALTQDLSRLEAEQSLYSAKSGNNLNGNLNISYGVNQYAKTLSEAYQKPDSRQSVTVGLKIPVFQWGLGRNKVQIAENNYKSTVITIENDQKKFWQDLNNQIANYNYQIRMWSLAERARTLSKEQYSNAIHRFESGKTSVYELFSAQKEQMSAMQRYYDSVRAAWDSYFTLRKATLYDFVRGVELVDLYGMKN